MTSLIRIMADNQSSHLKQILEIEDLSFSAPWSAAGFMQEIRNPAARLWAAVLNEKPAGFVCYWMLDFEIQLLNLAVHPLERRKGLGRFLLNHMIEEGASRSLETVWLEVRVSNTGAVRLYRNFGFEEVGVRRKYYDDTKEDAIVMCLPLSGASGITQRYEQQDHP